MSDPKDIDNIIARMHEEPEADLLEELAIDTPALDAAIEMLMDTSRPVHQTEFRLNLGSALSEVRRLLGGKP